MDLGAVFERFRGTIYRRIDALSAFARSAAADAPCERLRSVAQGEAHKLAGSMATFGYEASSILAREAEALLALDAGWNRSDTPRLQALIAAIETELGRA